MCEEIDRERERGGSRVYLAESTPTNDLDGVKRVTREAHAAFMDVLGLLACQLAPLLRTDLIRET